MTTTHHSTPTPEYVAAVAAVAAGLRPEHHATPELRAAHQRYVVACRAAGIIPAIPTWSLRDRPSL